MSIGFLKRLLSIAKLAAVLSIVGAAYGYWDHHQDMDGGWIAPDFRPSVKPPVLSVARIEAVGMQLGRYQKEVPVDTSARLEQPKEEIKEALAKLGVIKSAIAAYPPFTESQPAIIFQFHQPPAGTTETIRTIELGQALLEKPHQNPQWAAAGYTVPYRYKFVGCERDPEGRTLFVFDMNCDGQDLQKALWVRETEEKIDLPKATDGGPEGLKPVVGQGYALVDNEAKKAANRPPAPATTETEVVQPTEPAPAPVPSAFGSGDFFEEENGALAVTDKAAEYLKNNYQNILKDASTQIYKKGGRAAGVHVVNIKAGSMANQFGILKGDVILAINDVPVTNQSQAVSVVKRELKKKPTPRYITVRILRTGRTIVKRFDTRDPETRRRARKAFR
ncbi:MAG: PDZ domain-containing protein [Planctomycetota bacterium]|jgi:hypothetical protein